MEFEEYKKYRWFYTSTGKLVVGGKNAEQNDDLLTAMKKMSKDYWVMHTSSPGSPFSIIICDPKKVSKTDLKETAIFTGCFSREWRAKKQKVKIDIFKLSQVHKNSKMKEGTWGVLGKRSFQDVQLKLVLTKQKGILRAVPEPAVKNKKDIILKICPGNVDKSNFITKINVEIGPNFKEEEFLSALPAGGISICKK